jgi:hypothetical protein
MKTLKAKIIFSALLNLTICRIEFLNELELDCYNSKSTVFLRSAKSEYLKRINVLAFDLHRMSAIADKHMSQDDMKECKRLYNIFENTVKFFEN